MAEETEYSVVMELGDWFVIDATMDDELQVLAQAGRNFDDWGDETARDPYWAELDELAMSVRRVGWSRMADSPRGPESFRRWASASAQRREAFGLSGRQWGMALFALESRADLTIAEGVRPEYHEPLRSISENRRRVAALVRRRLAEAGLEQVPSVRPDGR